MTFLVRFRSFTILRLIWWNFFQIFFSPKFAIFPKKGLLTFFAQHTQIDNICHQKPREISYLMVYLVVLQKWILDSIFFHRNSTLLQVVLQDKTLVLFAYFNVSLLKEIAMLNSAAKVNDFVHLPLLLKTQKYFIFILLIYVYLFIQIS